MEKMYKEFSESLSMLSEEELQNNFFSACLTLNIPFAFWRNPGKTEKNFITEFTSDIRVQKLNINNGKAGFVISAFLNPDNQESLLIKPDFHYNFESHAFAISETDEVKDKKLSNQFWDFIFSSGSTTHKLNNLPDIFSSLEHFSNYIYIVEKAKEKIGQNEFKKVVVARQKIILLKNNFNPVEAFNQLCEDHLNAFVSLSFVPGKGLWLGASPEILLSIDSDKIFKTSALAGTQKLCKEESLSKANWTQKEIEEQALVSRYIINCFKTIRLREYEEDGPRTFRAGNLVHLRTDYSVDMKEVDFPELGTQMLDLLHPTSAVCGMPKEPALKFIKEQEGFNRKYFSGFIGPVNINEETNLYVNIRCAEIGNGKAMLYSGAGITGESNPERELEETELKMKTMERILSDNNIDN
jgi:isochorismate synthase